MSSISSRRSSTSSLRLTAAQVRADLAVAKAKESLAEKLREAAASLERIQLESEVKLGEVRLEALEKEMRQIEREEEGSGTALENLPAANILHRFVGQAADLQQSIDNTLHEVGAVNDLEGETNPNVGAPPEDGESNEVYNLEGDINPTVDDAHLQENNETGVIDNSVNPRVSSPTAAPFYHNVSKAVSIHAPVVTTSHPIVHSASSPSPVPLNSFISGVKLTPMLDVTPEASNHGDVSTLKDTEGVSNALRNLLQKQGDVFAQFAIQSSLPKKELHPFNGEAIDYARFLRAFEYEIERKVTSDKDRLYYLEQYTDGEVNRLVKSYMVMESKVGYTEAKKALAKRYGDPFKVADAYLNKIRKHPDIKSEDSKSLSDFSLLLLECQNVMTNLDHLDELNHTRSIQLLMKKLPYKLRDRWRTKTDTVQEKRKVEFKDFVEFVDKQARVLNNPTYGDIIDTKITKPTSHPNERSRSIGRVFAVLETPCLHCNGSHTISKCRRFAGMTHEDKVGFIKEKGLCFGCLHNGHISKSCDQRHVCEKCGKRHPTSLHWDKPKEVKPKEAKPKEVTAVCIEESSCTLAVIPVRVRAKNGAALVTTYAFLDPGSTISFCAQTLTGRLGIKGKQTKIPIVTITSTHEMKTEIIKDLMVSSLDGDEEVTIPISYTKEHLPVDKVDIPTQRDVNQWPHLQDVSIREVNADVELLIGMRVGGAYTPLEIKTGPVGAPHATRTRLGWVLWNLVKNKSNSSHYPVHWTESLSYNKVAEDGELLQIVRKSAEMDFPEKGLDSQLQHSVEDKLFLKRVAQTIHKGDDNHYTIGLPFRNDDVVLPNNKYMVVKRLQLLKVRLQKDAKLHLDYTKFMQTLLDKGYAERVGDDRKDAKNKWYIPHHGVYHPHKPKLRVVFDCAAKAQGIALNDILLPGPNLTNNLLGVLLRFRENKVALMADVEAMFYQVYVLKEDKDFLRFLWFPGGNLQAEPEEYRMRVHLFGATSSPACANSALLKTAEDGRNDRNHKAVETIKKNFYVDDLLKSVCSPSEGIQLMEDLTNLCSKGGFNLTKWSSNDKQVIESIPKERRSKELQNLNFKEEGLPQERALGVNWSPEDDFLHFSPPTREHPLTKRGLLATLSSIFDPMGLVGPAILPARLVLQETMERVNGWDDVVPDDLLKVWKRWWSNLSLIEGMKIPRWLGIQYNEGCQLHAFADASEKGYGVVTYVRTEADNIRCNILYSRSRVAPLKRQTIPRLELTAATLAVKCVDLITREMEVKFADVYYWTDSVLVLNYINNKKTRFSTFIANRINTIHSGSRPEQWRHVEGKINPADIASRGLNLSNGEEVAKWLGGPGFLWKDMEQWPKPFCGSSLEKDDPEVKEVACVATKEEDPIEQLILHYSSFHKLKRVIAWMLRIRKALTTHEVNKSAITLDELKNAEIELIKYVQRRNYIEEINSIKNDNPVKKSSTIGRLDPFLKEGVLRVGGRLRRSTQPSVTKHPAIVPKEHHVANLILMETHKIAGHCGRNQLICMVRKKYWIPKLPSAARGLVSKCVTCRRYHRNPETQKMADLPEQRITIGERPFCCTGMDYFGPLEVKRGRSMLKRYGVLFTCFKTRAVHLEVACSLTTDSCINALRRFVSRRGPMEMIRSDNGTNLVGAKRELQEALKEVDIDKVQREMLKKNISWQFNPPAASHFGGVWERMIRSTRRVLYGVLKEQPIKMDDEGLSTLLCEAENIINSRPLTINPDSPKDLEPLTPNHFLLGTAVATTAPGLFTNKDIVKSWRQVQYLTDLFWKRWSNEYLTTLQERQRWLSTKRNIAVGDIVLIVDNSPRGSWPMARVEVVHKDMKDIVRSVQLRTKSSTLVRPIAKLILVLEADD